MTSLFFRVIFIFLSIFLFLKIAPSSNFLFNLFSKKPQLQRKIEALQYEKAILEAKNFELQELKKENLLLKKALKLQEERKKRIILAKTIFASPFNFNPSFLIDKGKKAGLKEGDIVLLNEKIVIGRIKEVKEDFSKVATFFDKENSATVMIENYDLIGALKPKDQKIFLDLIPKDVSLKGEENIYTSGLDFKYPRGLLVGRIKKIKTSEALPFLEIELELPYRWYQISEVLIMEK